MDTSFKQYFSNTSKTPETICKNIFHYLWQSNTEPIAREAIFLPKKKWGINIKEPEAHNYSMRIKHPFSLKQEQKLPPWTYLATYWLAKDISNFSRRFHYLKNNNRVKTTNPKTPFYYNDTIYYIKVENKSVLTL